jgi:hypothetical protein
MYNLNDERCVINYNADEAKKKEEANLSFVFSKVDFKWHVLFIIG